VKKKEKKKEPPPPPPLFERRRRGGEKRGKQGFSLYSLVPISSLNNYDDFRGLIRLRDREFWTTFLIGKGGREGKRKEKRVRRTKRTVR